MVWLKNLKRKTKKLNLPKVLNRNWQAINTRTPAEAFCQMATNVATPLDIDGENYIRPGPGTNGSRCRSAIRIMRGAIRVPTVIVAVSFAKVPKKRPKLCAKSIRERDGNRCQYTGKLLRADEGSLDTFFPAHAAARTHGRTLSGQTRK
jgi:hypothetical protein